jgi:hypothetical protein
VLQSYHTLFGIATPFSRLFDPFVPIMRRHGAKKVAILSAASDPYTL